MHRSQHQIYSNPHSLATCYSCKQYKAGLDWVHNLPTQKHPRGTHLWVVGLSTSLLACAGQPCPTPRSFISEATKYPGNTRNCKNVGPSRGSRSLGDYYIRCAWCWCIVLMRWVLFFSPQNVKQRMLTTLRSGLDRSYIDYKSLTWSIVRY